MLLTKMIQDAINEAARVHDGQRRISGLPYIVHPVSVAWHLQQYIQKMNQQDQENIIVAALLHGIPKYNEHYSYQDLVINYNRGIADIVNHVSEPKRLKFRYKRKKTWMRRKENHLRKLRRVSIEAKIIACSSKIHNLKSTMEYYPQAGETIWSKFDAHKEDFLWFNEAFIEAMKESGFKHQILTDFETLYKESLEVFKIPMNRSH
ncbi:MAG: HD domain-containing protein [bacterium]